MPKTSVPTKMLDLCGLYIKRMDMNLKADNPETAVFWAVMVHSQGALARAMLDDGQMHQEAFGELNHYDQRALKVIERLGPATGGSMSGGAKPKNGLAFMLSAYEGFRQEAEMLGVI